MVSKILFKTSFGIFSYPGATTLPYKSITLNVGIVSGYTAGVNLNVYTSS